MDEKLWLKESIKAILQQRQLSNEKLADYIIQLVESYEAMKEI